MPKERRTSGIFNKKFVRLGAAALAIAGGMGTTYIATHPDYLHPTLPALSGEHPTLSDKEVIQQEIEHLGISESYEELRRWDTLGYKYDNSKLPNRPELFPVSAQRVNNVLILMQNSENPYFKQAAEFVAKNNDVTIVITPSVNTQKGPGPGGITPEILDGKLHYKIRLSQDYILNKTDALGLASVITDYAAVVEYLKREQDSLSNESIEELFLNIRAKSESVDSAAIGSAAQMNSFLYSLGLGEKGILNSSFVPGIAAFIRTGRNPESGQWKNYILANGLGKSEQY